ncbi:MAG: TonB-dependent receptor [Candidatus Pseudobacter hemicellulosilyticus]|uniref:TonB-dependent receptor n=1 Tax=Candidatus Pseudobacter hemicellulosilyticus TaxID=3121375 RepID=A0AAJ5WU38_9BACT|nr:MAG: TonB-dependent receptor [Pseudobacter sp.]
MKFTILFILLGMAQVQAKVHGQGSITLDLQQTSIEKVLNRIEKNGEFRFLYNYDLQSLRKKVSIKVERSSLSETLRKLFRDTDLAYKVLANNLVVVISTNAARQDIRITGKVTGPNNEPLPGVSVQVIGATTGTSTNNDGEYALTADPKATLRFSYIGYESKDVPVNGQNIVNAQLAASDKQMDQVVVVGYGAQRKGDITGAVATVRAADFNDRPIVNAAQALQGQAAGVNVMAPSGKPGWALAVSIRGNTSLNAVNDPLYVVDGVIVRNIDFLNPQDIESFSVLKDASSAAIYGASGANGVVLITTKKGASGQGKISISAYTGFSNFPKTMGVLDRQQYLDLMSELEYTDNNPGNTDWQKETFGTGREHSLQLALSGGNAGNRYYVSLGYQKQKGVVAPADYGRYSARVNLDSKVKEWLSFTTNINYARSEFVDVADNAGVARGGTILSALTSPPTIGIYNEDGTFTSNPNKGGWENPISAAFGPDQKSRDNRFIGNLTADARIIPGLNFRSNFGAEFQSTRWDYFLDPYRTDYGRSQKGYGKSTSTQRFVWLWENTLNYTKKFGEHNLTALAGTTIQESRWQETYGEGRDFPNAAVRTLNAAAIKLINRTNESEWAKRSYLGRVNYGYDDRYLLTANIRYDGSSRFPGDSRYGWFPSIAAAWRISNELFMGNQGLFSDLKLRVGWGKTGNDEGIGDYNYYPLFVPDGLGGIEFKNLPKPGLTWEKTDQTNIGLDMSFLNNRISIVLDGYIKKTTDLLVSVQPPPSSGFEPQVYNVGAIENKGFEFSVNALAVNTNLKWTINANFSTNRNRVTDLGEFTRTLSYAGVYERGDAIRVEKGRPLGAMYGYVSNGVDPATGMLVYEDLDKDGSITSEGDRTYIGNAQPDFIYGITNSFRFQQFELSFFLQGTQGNDLFNASRIELESMNDSKNQSTAVLDRWKTAGQLTSIPKAIKGSTENTQISSRYVEDGSYLRMRAITLSYAFRPTLLECWGLSRLNLYATAQNLFTITNYSGFDPEVSQFNNDRRQMGIDYGTYPQSRSFIFGVNVDF